MKSRNMLVTIQFGICCLPVCYLRTQSIQNYNFVWGDLYGCATVSLASRENHRLRARQIKYINFCYLIGDQYYESL